MRVASVLVLVLALSGVALAFKNPFAAINKDDDYDDYDYFTDEEIEAFFEKKIREITFSVQQIWSNAGPGANLFIDAVTQAEVSLNRPVWAELLTNFTTEVTQEPFLSLYEPFVDSLDFDLSNLGTRIRTFLRQGIQTIVSTIESNPETSIFAVDSVQDLWDSIYTPFANVFGTFGFLVSISGPLFPIYYAVQTIADWEEAGLAALPLKKAFLVIQIFFSYVAAFITNGQAVYNQLLIDFPASPYFQLVLTQIRESYAFYANMVGEPFNMPGLLGTALRLTTTIITATLDLIPKLLDNPDSWATLQDKLESATEAYYEENELDYDVEPTAALYEEVYIGVLGAVVAALESKF